MQRHVLAYANSIFTKNNLKVKKMSKYFKRNHNSNRVVLAKGMSIEMMCDSSNGMSTKDMQEICIMFSNKYNTKCEKGFLKMSDIDIEKLY